ncbi:unnamed protein product [Zymoseptoria tritici ST99CH_1A5]|uniref:Uncharacterized protein n=1 Tax=Zymoseptoria tritici ST99CH_1A5 TaxID=1276529 RepID=A0A1Y6M1Z2_ZYMTR|nr:unnamed protein product [Zymoseptoria tritici ST99CH_1A5]
MLVSSQPYPTLDNKYIGQVKLECRIFPAATETKAVRPLLPPPPPPQHYLLHPPTSPPRKKQLCPAPPTRTPTKTRLANPKSNPIPLPSNEHWFIECAPFGNLYGRTHR